MDSVLVAAADSPPPQKAVYLFMSVDDYHPEVNAPAFHAAAMVRRVRLRHRAVVVRCLGVARPTTKVPFGARAPPGVGLLEHQQGNRPSAYSPVYVLEGC
jgi:hypothetical protein